MIVWSDDMSVGVEGLDADHRVLIQTLSVLEDVVRGVGKNQDDLEDLLASSLAVLAEYAVVHFEREEHVLREIAFPDLTDHAEEHRQFWDGVTSRAEMPQVLTDWLSQWLTYHILGSDQKYAAFIRQRGLVVDLPPMSFGDLQSFGHGGRRVEIGGVEV